MAVDDFINAFTPEQLRRKLFSSRIKFDPMSYSLKGNVIPKFTTKSVGIDTYGFRSCEQDFQNLLITDGYDTFVDWAPVGKKATGSVPKHYSVSAGSNLATHTALCVRNNNVYLPMDQIYFGKSFGNGATLVNTDLNVTAGAVARDTGVIIDDILYFIAGMTHHTSLIPYMIWLEGKREHPVTLSDAIDFKPITDALNDRKVPACAELTNLLRIPYVYSMHNGTTCQFMCTDVNCDDEKAAVSIAYGNAIRAIAYGLEMLHIIKQLDEDTQLRIYQLFRYGEHNDIVDRYLFYNAGGSIKLTDMAERISSIDDADTRWNEIYNYVNNFEVYTTIDKWIAAFKVELGGRGNVQQFPTYFALLLQCCIDYSITNARVMYTKLLCKQCQFEGLDIRKTADGLHAAAGTEDPDADFASTLSDAVSDIADKAEPSIMASPHEYSSESKPKETSKKSNLSPPTLDALDKADAAWDDSGYTFNVTDIINTDSASSKRAYDKIAMCTKLINRNLIKQLKEIKTYNTGGKAPGQTAGKLDRKRVHMYRHTDKIFYNNTYKVKESDLAIGIVLDASGSMCGDGIKNGRTTMIVLHETLKALGINHSIITHTSHGQHNVILERYQAFNEDKTHTVRKNYALCKITAHTGNCDSGALYYMEQALLRTKNKDKICLMFSDGQPTECTGGELRAQVAHMERNHIKVIGIGIDYPSIADYYNDYANGKNLKDMLDIVVKILKQYVLDKKD